MAEPTEAGSCSEHGGRCRRQDCDVSANGGDGGRCSVVGTSTDAGAPTGDRTWDSGMDLMPGYDVWLGEC